jgi:hypothetical protein
VRRAAALVCLAFVAGCGDEGGDKATYVKAGDEICTAYANDIAKLGQPDTLTEIGPYVTKAMPVLQRAVGRLEKLDPPSDLRDAYDKFRDTARATVDRADRLREAAAAGDSVEVESLLAEAAKASAARAGLARDAGLEACAKL